MVYDSLLRRRSIRQFTPQKVEREKVERLLRAALLSPSSRNIRPWAFIVVDDVDIIRQLSGAKPHGAAFLESAPLAVVVAGDEAQSDVWVEDTAIASTVLLLMAEELGLGACWCQIRLRPHDDDNTADDFTRSLLALPERFKVESIIGLGYAAEERPPYEEAALLYEKCRHNRFDTPYNVSS